MFGQAAGEAEIAADGLANALAVKRAGERINDAVGDGAVKFVALIQRRDKIKAIVENRIKQKFDPFRRDAAQIGVDDATSFGAQSGGQGKNGAEGAALAGNAVITGDDFVHRKLRMPD